MCIWQFNFLNLYTPQYLPIYTPSEEEKSDPALFANNVRHVMAKWVCVPVCVCVRVCDQHVTVCATVCTLSDRQTACLPVCLSVLAALPSNVVLAYAWMGEYFHGPEMIPYPLLLIGRCSCHSQICHWKTSSSAYHRGRWVSWETAACWRLTGTYAAWGRYIKTWQTGITG